MNIYISWPYRIGLINYWMSYRFVIYRVVARCIGHCVSMARPIVIIAITIAVAPSIIVAVVVTRQIMKGAVDERVLGLGAGRHHKDPEKA